jgi:hypothetical protein
MNSLKTWILSKCKVEKQSIYGKYDSTVIGLIFSG